MIPIAVAVLAKMADKTEKAVKTSFPTTAVDANEDADLIEEHK